MNNKKSPKSLVPEDLDRNSFFYLSSDLFVIADTDGYFRQVNSSWSKTLGWSEEELLSKTFLHFVHPEDKERTLEEFARQKDGQKSRHFVNRYRCKDDSYRWLEWTSTSEINGLIYAAARDKTEEVKITQERDRFFNISIDLLVIANTDGTFRKVNDKWKQIFGWEREEMENRPFFDFIHPEDIAPTQVELEREKQGESVYKFVNRYRTKDGNYRWLEWIAEPEPDGTIYGVARDITARKENEEKMRQLALTDSLTGLANRNKFRQSLEQSMQLAKREKKPLALLMLDLDHFKLVNDTFGHTVGDALLEKVAETFTRLTRETDTVARLGGDEFSILLVHPENQESTINKANAIIQEISKITQIMENEINIGVSIGIAFYPYDADKSDDLMNRADLALYQAKAAGRGIVTVYDEAFSTKIPPQNNYSI